MSIIELLPEILDKAANVVAGASLIATVTATKKDDSVLSWLRTAINFFALNFGHAKNIKPANPTLTIADKP